MHVGQRIENPVAGDSVTFTEIPSPGSARLVMEMITVPGGDGPPLHIHPVSTEQFEVLEGSLGIELDGEYREIQAGDSITIPVGAEHRFVSAGEVPARTRVTFDQGGLLGEFLETFYELAQAGRLDAEGKPSMLQIAVSFSRYRNDIRATVAPWPAQLAMFAVLGPIGRLRGLKAAYAYGSLTGDQPSVTA